MPAKPKTANKTISFDTGVEEYLINDVPVRFNPTDTAFVKRMWGLFEDLEKSQEGLQQRVDEISDEDPEAMFDLARERDAQMRELIDGLFGEGIADKLFPNMNCYALAGGLPVWVNLMFAVAEEVEAAFEREQGKADPRLHQYNAKYEAMRKKYRRKK